MMGGGPVDTAAAPAPAGTRPPLWPPVPREVTVAKVIIGVVLSAAALYAPFYFEPTIEQGAVPGHLPRHRGDGPQPAHRVQRPGVDRPRRLLRRRRLHHRHPDDRLRLDVRGHDPGRGGAHRRARRRSSASPRCGCGACTWRWSRSAWRCCSRRVAQKFVDGPGGVALLRPPRSEFASLIDSPRRRPVAVLRLPGRRGRAVRPGLEPGPQPDGPGHDRRAATRSSRPPPSASTWPGTKVATFAISAAYAGVAGSLSVMIDRAWPTPPTPSSTSSARSSSSSPSSSAARPRSSAPRSARCCSCCCAATPTT